MTNQLISVIVPVYNEKNYIDCCLKGLTEQTYENLEIIVVDDGSSDGSSEICDAWTNKDKRIKVIHQKNGGLSNARNTGMRSACGQALIKRNMIWFLLCATGFFYFKDRGIVSQTDVLGKRYVKKTLDLWHTVWVEHKDFARDYRETCLKQLYQDRDSLLTCNLSLSEKLQVKYAYSLPVWIDALLFHVLLKARRAFRKRLKNEKNEAAQSGD